MLKRKSILLVLTFLMSNLLLIAQNPPSPPDRGSGGPVGGSAPIGDGHWILISLAFIYLLWKYYKNLKLKKSIG